MPVDLLRAHDARRSLGGEAAISLGVAVEKQGVGDGIRDTDAVVGAGHGRKVGREQHRVARILGLAQEGDDALVGVVDLEPLEIRPA